MASERGAGFFAAARAGRALVAGAATGSGADRGAFVWAGAAGLAAGALVFAGAGLSLLGAELAPAREAAGMATAGVRRGAGTGVIGLRTAAFAFAAEAAARLTAARAAGGAGGVAAGRLDFAPTLRAGTFCWAEVDLGLMQTTTAQAHRPAFARRAEATGKTRRAQTILTAWTRRAPSRPGK